jgi:propanediol dehydratase small subunit
MVWDYSVLALVLVFLAGLAIGFPAELRRRKRLQKLETGICRGRDWRRRFPQASKNEIRDFLGLVVDAFSIKKTARLNFSPDKQILDIYQAIYQPGSSMECLELETFAMELESRYGINADPLQRDDVTLGDILEYVISHRRPQS